MLICLDPYECSTIYSSSPAPSPFPRLSLLAGKCSLAIRGRGALDFWSNPLTQTYPAICPQGRTGTLGLGDESSYRAVRIIVTKHSNELVDCGVNKYAKSLFLI
ncbi:hypothetical protein V6N13_059805 [Hibiscus sabdariffa]